MSLIGMPRTKTSRGFSQTLIYVPHPLTPHKRLVGQNDREIVRILADILSYVRLNAAASVRGSASKAFDFYEKVLVYSKMDGKTSTYKIAEITGVPQRTVADWGDDLVKSGLASPPTEFHASHRALFSLSELSIDLSAFKRRRKAKLDHGNSSAPAVSAPEDSKTETRERS